MYEKELPQAMIVDDLIIISILAGFADGWVLLTEYWKVFGILNTITHSTNVTEDWNIYQRNKRRNIITEIFLL